jgi:acyl transferase domain-containing protein
LATVWASTALSVSKVLSLRDGLKFVARRAALMIKHWGGKPGIMVVLDADLKASTGIVEILMSKAPRCRYEIDSYNGPECYVIVSDRTSAAALEAEAIERGMRYNRLNTQDGFHSRFTGDLYPYLEHLAESLEIRSAKIHLETCSPNASWAQPTAKFIAAHTREPVFFTNAVHRVRSALGPCTWLEAGSRWSYRQGRWNLIR